MTYRQLWDLLRPFHRHFNRYRAGIVLRQALLLLGGYSLVWALRACLVPAGVPAWVFGAAFILFDNALNFFLAQRVSYPLFGHLRVQALAKIFRMPMEWHHRKNSGTLVGEVNNGVGKVVQTAEGLSRELFPAIIQTGFSLVPLMLFSPGTTPAVLAALALFLWLTVVIIAHRLSTVRKIADWIVVLGEEGIAEQGTHAELIQRNGWYAEMARLQATAPLHWENQSEYVYD